MDQLALMLIFAPVIADTLVTVIRRTWTGHHPFVPHCDFYYQRMVLAGVPQRDVLGLYFLATILYGWLALLLR